MHFLTKRFLGVMATILAISGCSGMPSLNPMNWLSSDSEPKMAELPEIRATATIRVLWQASIGAAGDTVLSPAMAAGNTYAVAGDGTVVKIDVKAGNSVWKANVGTRLSGGAGSDGILVAVGSPEGEVIALEAESGVVRWRARVSSEVLSAPVVAGDIVLIRSADSRVFALDSKDGRRRWVYQRSAASLSIRSPAGLVVAQGNAYGGFSGGKLVAIALSNGGVRWETTVALPQGTNELDRVTDVVGLPWVSEREICAVAFQGRVACFDLSNGNSLWGREMSSVSGVSGDVGQVYVSDDKGAVHALARSSGTSVWKQDRLFRRSLTLPVPVGRQIIVGDIQGYVHLLARDSGAFEGRIATDGSPLSSPIPIADGSFLVQSRSGNLFALAFQ